ncbi:DUF4129 domain-containing protein [Lentzea sp. NPDC058450]|uniref:DUF4129 domain-containing protein n=1 Tax=Lentzea sp. NPDC058450 TaxID=3346505 RepID=UPI0036483685
MKWWRAGVAVAALLIVVVAAGGTSPITLVQRLDDRPPADNGAGQVDVPLPTELPGMFAVPLTVYLVVLAVLVLFGFVGILLALQLPRWRRRGGVRGVEIEGFEVGEQAVVRRVEKALQEFTKHPERPPRDAVIAAWLALEAAEERLPHQTPTEFTDELGVDATVLKDLYQRARFGHEDVTAAQAEQARQELDRIVRELA